MTKEESSSMYKSLTQKVIQYLGKEEVRQRIQGDILDPLLNHIMKRVFPYIILTCVLFVLLLIVVLLTLGIIIFQLRGGVVAAPVSGILNTV